MKARKFRYSLRYFEDLPLSYSILILTKLFFCLAVTKNQFKTARLLLKSGANVNAPGPEGQTPLVDAVLNNNTKVNSLYCAK